MIRQLFWCVFALALLVFSLGISWQVSKATNFLYHVWYQTLEINTVISKSVPKNTQGKRDFPIKDVKLHEKKFADIVQSIHHHGDGLTDISYLNHQGILQKLLTTSEVQHLQDVANLLDNMSKLWWGNLLFLLSLLIFYGHKVKQLTIESIRAMPTAKQKLISLACFVFLVIAMLGIWGFTKVFYYLHTVIFPNDHQWFFYYQDSLMSSLMKAPDIFAAIAGQLILIAILLALIIDVILSRYQRQK
ncbi:DUF1461 domain-containing protein [Colwellia sp. MB3u-70]|uniref:lipoprotein intramolecular transacylase Lit n=1 Tax=unclassified Colwellia TaxID=196834 RepID=UPI0015F5CD45|nr:MULTISPECIES: DUF1461 domain-containing protein [unclassified Colwellia]MBA6292375.1 DUF1461 domain-containing protein [Colwellia sp. MB3u-8]MBA6307174.1 DUF1461 domain-containing protein [Colwellia sp. MB3u-70]